MAGAGLAGHRVALLEADRSFALLLSLRERDAEHAVLVGGAGVLDVGARRKVDSPLDCSRALASMHAALPVRVVVTVRPDSQAVLMRAKFDAVPVASGEVGEHLYLVGRVQHVDVGETWVVSVLRTAGARRLAPWLGKRGALLCTAGNGVSGLSRWSRRARGASAPASPLRPVFTPRFGPAWPPRFGLVLGAWCAPPPRRSLLAGAYWSPLRGRFASWRRLRLSSVRSFCPRPGASF